MFTRGWARWGWAFLFVVRIAGAVDILDTAENIFFQPDDRTRTGIEVEFAGMTPEKAASVVARAIGGKIVKRTTPIKTTVDRILADGTKVYKEALMTHYIIEGSRIGEVDLKPENNQTSDFEDLDLSKVIVELVTEPIRYSQIPDLQRALNALRAAGATGTSPTTAVSAQVNAEIAEGGYEKAISQNNIDSVVNLLRAYMKPEHRKMIREHLRAPEIRQPFVGDYSPGFMTKLLNPSYRPTARELYDDYIYRQSFELLGEKEAWSLPIEIVRTMLLNHQNPIVPRVVKLNAVRISSLLMFLFPDDPMTKLYKDSGWAVARPLIEFREWNNEFDILSPVKQVLGLIEGSKLYGNYDHDTLVEALTGVSAQSLKDLRAQIYSPHRQDPVIFRYLLGDQKSLDTGEYKSILPHYGDRAPGMLAANQFGLKPVRLRGESVVFHRRHLHRGSILGKYNPGLINFNLQQALENKYVESLFWEEFSPGAMPKTVLLAHIAKDPAQIVQELGKIFPRGWVIKGVWDLGTEKNIITNSSRLPSSRLI
jgi:hypothetical protein